MRDRRGVNLRLTHRDVAALLATSRETATPALVELRRGWARAAGRPRLVLLDLGGLDAIARGAAPESARPARSS